MAEDLARQVDATFDFFFFLLAGAGLASLALILDAQALLVAAALVAPVLTPAFGIALSSVTGSHRFFLRALAALLVGLALALILSALVAWIASGWLGRNQMTAAAQARSQISPFDLLLAAAGGGFTALALARSPESARLPGVALAHAVLPPLAGVAFGLVAGETRAMQGAFAALLAHLGAAILAAAAVYWALGFRPVRLGRSLFGLDPAPWVTAGLLVLWLGITVWAGAMGFQQPEAAAVVQPFPTPNPTSTQPNPTHPSTLVPSLTSLPTRTPDSTPTLPPTETPAPSPTPLIARVMSSEGLGTVLRDKPDGRIIGNLPEHALVRILEISPVIGQFRWLHIVDAFGTEGWMASINAATVTPVP